MLVGVAVGRRGMGDWDEGAWRVSCGNAVFRQGRDIIRYTFKRLFILPQR